VKKKPLICYQQNDTLKLEFTNRLCGLCQVGLSSMSTPSIPPRRVTSALTYVTRKELVFQ